MSASFASKMTLQFFNLLFVIGELVALCVLKNDAVSFITEECLLGCQILVWLLSMAVQTFEYSRSLGHAWYMHPLLWTYSTGFYALILVYLIEYSHLMFSDGTFTLFVMLQVVDTFLLTVLSCAYFKDHHYERRGYIDVEDR